RGLGRASSRAGGFCHVQHRISIRGPTKLSGFPLWLLPLKSEACGLLSSLSVPPVGPVSGADVVLWPPVAGWAYSRASFPRLNAAPAVDACALSARPAR